MRQQHKVWSYDLEKGKTVGPGQLLLSEPFMFDENFKRTVVLLCEHDEENGTVGLILNKPVNLRMQDVVEGFPNYHSRLYFGGPVGTDSLQFIHRCGSEVPDSMQIGSNIFWGGNFEVVKQMISDGKIQQGDIHFFLGYSGWGNGQLVEELKDNSWIISTAEADDVFIAREDLWKSVMNRLGGVYSVMAGYPENPILN